MARITPKQAIDDLYCALADGEMVTVRRYTSMVGNPRPRLNVHDVPAFVRRTGSRALIAAIDQGEWNVVIGPRNLDLLLPLRKGDKVVIDGRERNIAEPREVRVKSVLVRINLKVDGI